MCLRMFLVGGLGVLILAGSVNAQPARELSDVERLAAECTYVSTAERDDGALQGQLSTGLGVFRGPFGIGGNIRGDVSRKITHETIQMRNGVGDLTGSLQRTLDVQRMRGACIYEDIPEQVKDALSQVLKSQ